MVYIAPTSRSAGYVVPASEWDQNVVSNILALVDRIQVVRKPAAQNIISSSTLTLDADLKFTAVAGQTYVFDCALIFNSSSSAIDAKIGFTFPSGTLSFSTVAMDPAVAAGQIGSGNWVAASAATSATTALGVGVASADTPVLVRGSFLCTVGGTVTLMWAQNTLTATNMTLQAGSTLTAIRAAA